MAISKDLFLAILSMDSYNRGYSPGINLSGTAIGNASIDKTSSILLDGNGQPLDQPAGFYAISYNTSAVSGFSAGEKTIAYRGTDQLFPSFTIGSEIWNAYGVGAGSPGGNQAALAFGRLPALSGRSR